MFTEEEIEFLGKHDLCRVATISPNSYPHIVPVFYDFDGRYIYFGTRLVNSKKIRNIRANDKVGLVIDEYLETMGEQRGVTIEGKAEIEERKGYVRVRIEPLKKASWGIAIRSSK